MTFLNKIKNPKTQVSTKANVDDNDMLSAALATEKNMCDTYVKAMQEASHDNFYLLLFDMFKETSRERRKLVDLQFQHGWLTLTKAPTTEVAALEQEFNEAKQQLQ
ncbi:spore coat protein [Sporosarcina sp. FSL K6-1522]|uniref:spore coat protein n=1 Tax=Sporosarcina sp. FSL K6-1522 TaxID=2921554 RepID=UPI003159D211